MVKQNTNQVHLRPLRYLLALLLGVAQLTEVTAAEKSPIPDKYTYCTVCHGTLFQGNQATGAPRLTGLSEHYLTRQLLAFKQGKRGQHAEDVNGMEMRPMAAILSKRQIEKISKIVSRLSPQTNNTEVPAKSERADLVRGKSLYQSCSVCHGADAMGIPALSAPMLARQNTWYLAVQLSKYRSGIRGSEQSEATSQQMRAAASIIESDQNQVDLLAYIKSL